MTSASTSPTSRDVSSNAASLGQSLRLVATDIKLAHSVFALPFALLASFMAAGPTNGSIVWARLSGQLLLIVVAMVFARTCAMLANRLLDRAIDAENPRTSRRAMPSGKLSPSRAVTFFITSTMLFLTACVSFGFLFGNWWPTILGIPVLGWICAYGLFKRFTALCHLYLGSSLAISPLAAALAIDPQSLATQPSLYILGGMVLFWVAGFDIIYALQDIDIDRTQGLHSMPAKLGPRSALLVSRFLHILAFSCLIACWWLDPRFGLPFLAGSLVVAGLLVFEHATVSRWGTTKIALSFFTLNGLISCLLGGLGIVDVMV